MNKPIRRQREYVSGRISNEVMAVVIFFTFVAAILNISISPRVPEWYEQDSLYKIIGHLVSKTVINIGWTPIQGQPPQVTVWLHDYFAQCCGVALL